MTTIQKLDKYTFGTYGRLPLVAERGQGAVIYGDDNKAYIDFTSGIGVSSLGYGHKKWRQAVLMQAFDIPHTSNYYYTAEYANAAEGVCIASGYSKVFFGNSGTEANECAVKTARKYSSDKYKTDNRGTVLTLTGSFHGRTLAMLSATGQSVFHNSFHPFPSGFEYWELDRILQKLETDDTVCAVMFEYIQGEGGVVNLPQDFIDNLYNIAAKRDIIPIADEIQTGVGRTGKFLCGEWYRTNGNQADITTLAKGLGGGLPVGVCLVNDKLANTMGLSSHGSTFGGNAAVCAGVNAVIKVITADRFLDNVVKNGDYIRDKLNNSGLFGEVSGKGLMLGIEVKQPNTAEEIKHAAFDNGLLILTAKDKLRMLPPLTITQDEIDKGLEILFKVVAK
ncbi:MAG: aminotransferase class III-fold pyridoxal phosphate-dependent enzyme [Oscillospiraceae bacterium]|jgi:acetylornithine/N-succinyldiaminopimelate aminotransferase|nr:aminotransferase class III-fold pyridoxal phosphate-dependent enzyme [Oscillospiraceae bacterium]